MSTLIRFLRRLFRRERGTRMIGGPAGTGKTMTFLAPPELRNAPLVPDVTGAPAIGPMTALWVAMKLFPERFSSPIIFIDDEAEEIKPE
jgi:hypothetical protein